MSLLLAAGGAAPITGTLSATVGNATLSASGQVVVSGVMASTVGNATLVAAGNVTSSAVSGVLASTVGDFSAAFRGAAYSNVPKRNEELTNKEIAWLRGLFQQPKSHKEESAEEAIVPSYPIAKEIIPLTTAAELAAILTPRIEPMRETVYVDDDADLVAAAVAVATARQRAFRSRRAA